MNFALSTWISLHTGMPDDRNEHEVSYTGYQRQYAPMHGSGVADVTFPMYTDAGQCVVTHAGMRATRNGPLMMSVRLLPHVWLADGTIGNVKITCDDEADFETVVANATPAQIGALFGMQEERMLEAPDELVEFEAARLRMIQKRMLGAP